MKLLVYFNEIFRHFWIALLMQFRYNIKTIFVPVPQSVSFSFHKLLHTPITSPIFFFKSLGSIKKLSVPRVIETINHF